MTPMKCGACGAIISIPERRSSSIVRCGACGKLINVPLPASPAGHASQGPAELSQGDILLKLLRNPIFQCTAAILIGLAGLALWNLASSGPHNPASPPKREPRAARPLPPPVVTRPPKQDSSSPVRPSGGFILPPRGIDPALREVANQDQEQPSLEAGSGEFVDRTPDLTRRIISEPGLQPHPLPETGEGEQWFTGKYLPSLTVITPDGGHHFVKVEDWSSRTPVCTLFIRAGEQATVNLPPGEYKVKFAQGLTWYGTKHLFGKDTTCSVADKCFEFAVKQDPAGEVYTVRTIRLIALESGNLRTHAIEIEDF